MCIMIVEILKVARLASTRLVGVNGAGIRFELTRILRVRVIGKIVTVSLVFLFGHPGIFPTLPVFTPGISRVASWAAAFEVRAKMLAYKRH